MHCCNINKSRRGDFFLVLSECGRVGFLSSVINLPRISHSVGIVQNAGLDIAGLDSDGSDIDGCVFRTYI